MDLNDLLAEGKKPGTNLLLPNIVVGLIAIAIITTIIFG